MSARDVQSLKHLRLWQEEEIQADAKGLLKYPCPCMDCAGGKVLGRHTIRKHLQSKGRDPAFTASILVRKKTTIVFSSLYLYIDANKRLQTL